MSNLRAEDGPSSPSINSGHPGPSEIRTESELHPQTGSDIKTHPPPDDKRIHTTLPSVPDGGYGWVIVFSSFICNLIMTGIVNSSGVLLPGYMKQFKVGRGAASWAGSLLIGVSWCAGPIVSALTHKFGCRPVCMMGALLASLAFAVSYFSNSLPILILTYGLVGGLGFGMIYLPSIVSVGYYFERRRALATGVALCGSGFGTIIFTQTVPALLDNAGLIWDQIHLVFAGITLLAIGCGALMRPLVVQVKLVQDEETVEIDPTDPVDGDRSRAGSAGSAVSWDLGSSSSLTSTTSHISTSTSKKPRSNQGQKKTSNFSYQGKTYSFRAIPQGSRRRFSISSRTSGKNDKEPTAVNSAELLVDQPQTIRPLARPDAFYTGSVHDFEKLRGPLDDTKLIPVLPPVMPITPNKPPTDPKPKSSICSCCSRRNKGQAQAQAQSHHPGSHSAFRDTLTHILDMSILKNPIFVLITASNIFSVLGLYVVVVFLFNAAEEKIGHNKATHLLSIIGVTAIIGRILTGILSDLHKISSLLLSSGFVLIAGVSVCCLPFCNDFYAYIAFSVIFGVVIAGYNCLMSILLVEFLGLEKLTNAFGLISLFRGVAALVSAPAAGALRDAYGNYDIPFYVGGGWLVSAGLAQFAVPLAKKWVVARDNKKRSLGSESG